MGQWQGRFRVRDGHDLFLPRRLWGWVLLRRTLNCCRSAREVDTEWHCRMSVACLQPNHVEWRCGLELLPLSSVWVIVGARV